ncbi:MAG TPA: hypothetical protein VFJ19_21085 [Nocardioidaceae bacterium]|nr:hypothetical protein [Nocardioidaceae bacterium]
MRADTELSVMQDSLDVVLSDQDGVITRRRVLAAGFDDAFIRRRVRSNDRARIHPSREPARLRLEEAVLMTASEAPDDAEAIAIVADAW